MKIALASCEFKNNYPAFNRDQIVSNMRQCAEQGVDLVCFGEAFLQGFESLLWLYQPDTYIAVTQDSKLINTIRQAARDYKISVGYGYIELDGKAIYSSYMVIDKKGNTVSNYRRVSPGWLEKNYDPRIYLEGKGFSSFELEGHRFTIALCGDLWHDEHMTTLNEIDAEVVLWPVYCDYNPNEWRETARAEYVERSRLFNKPLLWINSICRIPMRAFGGALVLDQGEIIAEQTVNGEESLLLFELN